MGKYCDHDFFNITSVSTPQPAIAAATIGCIYCGQIRKIYTDGRVVVEIEEGVIERKRNGTSTSNTNNRAV